jgi:LemA protein
MDPISMVVIVLAVVLVLMVIGLYNRLVSLRNQHKNAFSQIDVQLNRRYDLIPNLVETAKAFMGHERETLEAVIKARNQAHAALGAAKGSQDLGKLVAAEGVLSKSLGSFMALSENYPQLKSDVTMKTLMEELSSTENKVAFARQHYNDSVMEYNTARETFPANLIAGSFGFMGAQSFEVENPQVRESVRVKF